MPSFTFHRLHRPLHQLGGEARYARSFSLETEGSLLQFEYVAQNRLKFDSRFISSDSQSHLLGRSLLVLVRVPYRISEKMVDIHVG